MPDTRESGDGSGPPLIPALARQPVGRLFGVGLHLRSALVAIAMSVSVVACVTSLPEDAPSDTFPPPTDAELERFCSRYEEVRDLSFSEMAAALVDYAPEYVILDGVWVNLKVELVAASKDRQDYPGRHGWIYEFISRCPPEEDLP